MMSSPVTITDLLPTDGSWPYPDWERVRERVIHLPEADRPAGWTAAARQWLDAVQAYLGDDFGVYESDEVLLLGVADDEFAAALLANARHARGAILDYFPEIARFDAPGKEVVLALPNPDLYYTYFSGFDSPEDGDRGGSIGCHIRDGYPHVVLCGGQLTGLTGTLAHELTHAALQHLDAPLWLEEGITQLVTRAAVGIGPLEMTAEIARAHKRHWGRHGLGEFWWGGGFHAPGRAQQLSYELAEVLMLILVEEHRPGWLGIGRGKRDRLRGFLAGAKKADAGTAAAAEWLGYSLGELAGKFLGPGTWEPTTADDGAG